MTTQEVLGEYLGFLPLALVGASIRAAATLPHGVVDGNSFALLRWEVSSSRKVRRKMVPHGVLVQIRCGWKSSSIWRCVARETR
jgi:hypothetical protein